MIRVQLKRLLRQHRMSQRELARRIRRHHDVVSRFARQDTSGVSYELLAEICGVLECQPGDLMRFDPDPELQIPLFHEQQNLGIRGSKGPPASPSDPEARVSR